MLTAHREASRKQRVMNQWVESTPAARGIPGMSGLLGHATSVAFSRPTGIEKSGRRVIPSSNSYPYCASDMNSNATFSPHPWDIPPNRIIPGSVAAYLSLFVISLTHKPAGQALVITPKT